MTPVALTKDEIELQKQDILKACERLVLKYGIYKVSVSDIVKEARIARGTFYKHFANKDECIAVAVFDSHIQQLEIISNDFKSIKKLNFKKEFKEKLLNVVDTFYMYDIISDSETVNRLVRNLPSGYEVSYLENEIDFYKDFLEKSHINTEKVKPEIVHNLLHCIFHFKLESQNHKLEKVDETLEILVDSLISYLSKGITLKSVLKSNIE